MLAFFPALAHTTKNTASAAQWHFNGRVTESSSDCEDWALNIISTSKKEYISCGYINSGKQRPSFCKLDHNGKLVWQEKVTTANGPTSTSQVAIDPGAYALTWQVVSAPDGYAAAGYITLGSNRQLLVVEFDDNGNFLNNTPTIVNLPSTFGSYSAINSPYCTTIAIDPDYNSIRHILIGGSVTAKDVGGTSFQPAFISKVAFTGSLMAVPSGAGNFFVQGFNGGNGEVNRFEKIVCQPTTSGYNVFASGYRAVSGDMATVPTLTPGVNMTVYNKDIWVIGLKNDLASVVFSKTFSKPDLTGIIHNDIGHFTARNFDAASGAIKAVDDMAAPTTFEVSEGITAALNSQNNMDERGEDMILTRDNNLALTAFVNNIHLATNDGNGEFLVDPSTSTVGTGDPYGEYRDQDGYLIKLKSADGTMIFNKNIGHFSGSDYRIHLTQDNFGRYIIAGSTADNYDNSYNLPDQIDEHAENSYLICTGDDASDNIWERSFTAFDSRQTAGEDCFCGFGICSTADDGFMICGNNDNNNDDWSITKFAPFQQNISLPTGVYETFGLSAPPDIHTVSGTETWTGTKTIASKIVVPAGATLNINNADIYFAQSDRMWDYFNFPSQGAGANQGIGIYVEPKGRLNISSSTLQEISFYSGSATIERGMWDGIVVHGDPTHTCIPANQGTVKITGTATAPSIIQEARYGLYVSDNYRGFEEEYASAPSSTSACDGYTTSSRYNGYATQGGGYVTTNYTNFQNCRYAANFQNYPNFSNPSTFNVSNFNCDASGMGDICFYTDGSGNLQCTNAYISDWNVHGLKFTDNTFTCDPSFAPAARPIGITGSDAGMYITRNCTPDISGGCSSSGPGNSFSNLAVATSFGFSPATTYSVRIVYNTFDNCGYGTRVNGSQNGLIIQNNNYMTPGIWGPYGSPAALLAYPTHVGVLLTGCHGYDVSENTFDKCSGCGTYFSWVGTQDIDVNNNHTKNDLINQNVFKNTWQGSWAYGVNGSTMPDIGLQFHCNQYSAQYSIGRASNAIGGGTASPGTIKYTQGSCGSSTSPAGNEFFLACGGPTMQTHLYADGGVTQNVVYSSSQSTAPFFPGTTSGCSNVHYGVISCDFIDPFSTTCPPPSEYLDRDGSSMGPGTLAALSDLSTLDSIIPTITDTAQLAALQAQHDLDVAWVVRYYNMVEDFSDAGDLLTGYGMYDEAIPFYLQSGRVDDASKALGSMPTGTDEQSLQAYLYGLNVSLTSAGQTWLDLGADDVSYISTLPQLWSQGGTTASTINELLGTGQTFWPLPQMDSAMLAMEQDSTLFTFDSATFSDSGGMRRIQPATAAYTANTVFSVFPNPNYGNFTVSTSIAGRFSLYTTDGRWITDYEIATGTNEQQLPQSLSPGIYMGVFRPADGSLQKTVRLVYEP